MKKKKEEKGEKLNYQTLKAKQNEKKKREERRKDGDDDGEAEGCI